MNRSSKAKVAEHDSSDSPRRGRGAADRLDAGSLRLFGEDGGQAVRRGHQETSLNRSRKPPCPGRPGQNQSARQSGRPSGPAHSLRLCLVVRVVLRRPFGVVTGHRPPRRRNRGAVISCRPCDLTTSVTGAAILAASAWAQAPKPDASRFLTQPLIAGIYTADPSAHVFDGRIFIYPSHDVETGFRPTTSGASSRCATTTCSRWTASGAPSRIARRAGHQERAVGGQADVGAGRGGAGWQVLPVLPREGQAGRLPDRRGGRQQTGGPVHRPAAADSGSYSIDPAVFNDSDGEYYMYFGGIWGGQLQRWVTGAYKAADVYPSADQPAISAKVALPLACYCGERIVSSCSDPPLLRRTLGTRKAASVP